MVTDVVETSEAQGLFDLVRSYLSPEKVALVEETYSFAVQCHKGQLRMSGSPYVEHPLQTALSLAKLHLDGVTIAAALLHDVIEDCGIEHEYLRERFGNEVAKLVDGVTKLTRMDLRLMNGNSSVGYLPKSRLQAESLRKMLVAMAEDIRVVLIKLADRLHNMRTLGVLPAQRRKAIAQETLDIYVPLAHRLGIRDFKWRLEDMAFRYLEYGKYREISKMLAVKREEREAYIFKVTRALEAQLDKEDIKAQVVGRPKNIYSIFQKMQKYTAQGKELSQIYDLYALRVLVRTKADCYKALGVVHDLWHPIPGQFDDYIAYAKENLYKSLHTTVMCDGGKPLEVQIRTYDMHQIAEHGIAAHWQYKEGGPGDIHFEEKMSWMRQLLEWQREVTGAEEFLESVKTDIFSDQVFVYTPKGDVVEMPNGATPIDFAYKIHTELGDRCIGAKVDGRLIALDTQLQNGNTVEVIASKVSRGPSLDWLNSDLGYIRNVSTREKVRQWFRRQERSTNIQGGRELLSKEIRRLNLSLVEAEVPQLFKYESLEDFLAALGSGGITENHLVIKLTGQVERPQGKIWNSIGTTTSPTTGVEILGVGDLLVRIANCCNPIPGDEIIGYITRNRGVTVHKSDCSNLWNEDERERLVKLEWGQSHTLYPVRIQIEALDRVGLLRDITTTVSEEKVNIASVVTKENPDGDASTALTLHTTGIAQLSRLFAKLEGIRGVVSVSRAGSDTSSTENNRDSGGDSSA